MNRSDFKTYEEAVTEARRLANAHNQSYGLEKLPKGGLPGYGPWVIFMIPNRRDQRFGRDLRCEPVEPDRYLAERFTKGKDR